MDIERWFESMPCDVVNDIVSEKRYIGFAIHDQKSLNFERQDYLIKDIRTMARKVKDASQKRSDAPVITKSSAGGSGKSQGKTRWANADIRSREHKEKVREMAANPNYVLDTLVELVDGGYELIIKRTDQGSTVRTMLFCHVDGDINKGGGLSAEAPDAWLSLTAIIYKHSVVLEGEWFDDGAETDEDDGWR